MMIYTLKRTTKMMGTISAMVIGITLLMSTFGSANLWTYYGWINPQKPDFYYERYEIVVNYVGMPLTNEPLGVNMYFPEGRCRMNSIRILWQNGTDPATAEFEELPYVIINKDNYTATDYLFRANITFVVPKLENANKYYICYSNNQSISAPDYTGQFLTVKNNRINTFYDGAQFVSTMELKYKQAGNRTVDIMIPYAGTGLDINITSAVFNITISPTFYEVNKTSIVDRFDGMGPTSVRMYNGSAYSGSGTYLFVSGPRGIYIYRYTGGNFVNKANITLEDFNGAPAQPGPVTVANIITRASADSELIFGLKNGTIYVYHYDGDTTLVRNETATRDLSGSGLKNIFGLGALNIYNNNSGIMEGYQDLVALAPRTSLSDGRMQSFWHNDTEVVGPSLFNDDMVSGLCNAMGGYIPTTNNDSYIVYSQMDHKANNDYRGDQDLFLSHYSIQSPFGVNASEFMVKFQTDQSGNNYLSLGIYHPVRDFTAMVTNSPYVEVFPRLSSGGSYYQNIQFMDPGTVGAVAFSKKFWANTNYQVLGAGVLLGNLRFPLYTINPIQTDLSQQGFVNYNYGYSSLSGVVQNYIYPDNGAKRLTSTWGNLDGNNSAYDDAFFVDDVGRYHFFTNNGSVIAPKSTGLLFDTPVDLYGNGYSIDAFDYSNDGIDDIVVADTNGFVHFLNFSFAKDVKTWTQYHTGEADFNLTTNFPGYIYYNDTNRMTGNMSTELDAFLGKRPALNGQYTNCSVNIETGTPCVLSLSNLEIYFETNNYTLMKQNRVVLPGFDPQQLGNFPKYIDFDNDGLLDFYEMQNIIVWDPASPFWAAYNVPTGSIYPFRNTPEPAALYSLGYNQSLPVPAETKIFNNDTDGDLLLDGLELLVYRTNPNSTDSDGDGLTDYEEVMNPSWGASPMWKDTDGEGLPDNIERFWGSNASRTNTDNDGFSFYDQNDQLRFVQLTDFDEVYKYGTHPCKRDTDGDGLTDLQELGIWNSTLRLINHLNSYVRPEGVKGSDVIYANVTEFIDLYYPLQKSFLHKAIGNGFGLNANSSDTDSDGLTDYQEIFGISVDGVKYYSDPLTKDTDSDGIDDGQEIAGFDIKIQIFGFGGDPTEVSVKGSLNPDSPDTDTDELSDGDELNVYKTNPIKDDTDGDTLKDGTEIRVGVALPNGTKVFTNASMFDTDGDGLSDGEEVKGILLTGIYYYFFGHTSDAQFSDPTKRDTDGDGWSDYEEVIIYKTNPLSVDTDKDGVNDPQDDTPVLNDLLEQLYYIFSGIGLIGAVVCIPLNRYSATKVLARKFIVDEKLQRRQKQLLKEHKEAKPFYIRASIIPSSGTGETFDVKMTMEIKDQSFFGRACKVSYSAGATEFTEVEAQKVGQEVYEFRLKGIPVDTRVLYYVMFLDKGGSWVKDDNDKKYYTFATNKDGTIDTADEDEWKVDRGVKCPVCGYLCLREWDECPECGTPLHESSQLSLTEDDAKKKEELAKIEQDKEAAAWEDAQKTDEVWRGLPPCPNCGMSVQPEWAKCPVCNFDLKNVELKKEAVYSWEEQDADYIEGKDEKEIQKEYKDDTKKTKSEKELLDEQEKKEKKKKDAWNTKNDDNIDIL